MWVQLPQRDSILLTDCLPILLFVSSGAVGIAEAGKENRCGSVNDSIECRLAVVLDTSVNGTSNGTAEFLPILIEPNDNWLYWMGGKLIPNPIMGMRLNSTLKRDVLFP